jgi:hypothetical protein
MKIPVFWDVEPRSLVDMTDVSEELIAYIIMVMMESVSSSGVSVDVSTRLHAATSRKAAIFILPGTI